MFELMSSLYVFNVNIYILLKIKTLQSNSAFKLLKRVFSAISGKFLEYYNCIFHMIIRHKSINCFLQNVLITTLIFAKSINWQIYNVSQICPWIQGPAQKSKHLCIFSITTRRYKENHRNVFSKFNWFYKKKHKEIINIHDVFTTYKSFIWNNTTFTGQRV